MNREIKFRVWQKRNKEMIDVGEMDFNLQSIYYNMGNISFDEFEIMQYTGLKDKNGKEIYEGDILKGLDWDDEEYITTVRFEDGAFIVNVPKCDYDYTVLGWGIGRDIAECEVIGNIYENPELLEKIE